MTLLDEIQARPELQQYVDSGNDTAIVEFFNAKKVDAKGVIQSHDIRRYLSLEDLRLAIKEGSSEACKRTTLALEDFEFFDCSNPVILAKLDSVLSGLVADALVPDFTEQDKAIILSLANVKISLAEQLGLTVNYETVAEALRGGV